MSLVGTAITLDSTSGIITAVNGVVGDLTGDLQELILHLILQAHQI